MDREQLVEILSTTLLQEVVSANIEKVNQLPAMLQDIGYIEDKVNVILQITESDVFDSEPLDIINFTQHGESLLITFEMPFILSAWTGKEQLLRITATATGKCIVPDIAKYDWASIDVENMGKEELLAKNELVDILELNYTDVECDDVSIL